MLVVIIVIFFFMSCNNVDSPLIVGEDWVNTSTKVIFIDTISVRSSTFKFDSLAVTNPKRLLVGTYNDPVLGLVNSKAYLQFGNSIFNIENTTGEYDLENSAKFDSINLVLKYDNYIYNDTVPMQSIDIYELTEDIEPDDKGNFYNTTDFAADPTAIGAIHFKPKPVKTDSILISLNHDFGKNIFNKILNNDINNQEEFLDEFKGLLIKPDNSNTVILGFSTSSYIRMFYTINSELSQEEEKYLDFNINTAYSFNTTKDISNNDVLNALSEPNFSIDSKSFNNSSIIQAGTGISTKIDIPYLESLYDINGDGILIDANLKLSIQKNTSNNLLKTRDSLGAYIIDNKFNIIEALTLYEDDTNVAYAELTDENSEYNVKTYSLPIKSFLDKKLSEYKGKDLSLALYSQDYNQSVDRYILAGEKSTNDVKLKIELFYAVYNE